MAMVMNSLSFVFGLLCLISIDVILGLIAFTFYRYFDLKYFSQLEISMLKEENKYLKEENKRVSGTSTEFWSDK